MNLSLLTFNESPRPKEEICNFDVSVEQSFLSWHYSAHLESAIPRSELTLNPVRSTSTLVILSNTQQWTLAILKRNMVGLLLRSNHTIFHFALGVKTRDPLLRQ